MIEVRAADARGRVDIGWLQGRYSFSFGEYYDPAHMGVSDLRVINDDYIAPGAGFPTHGHRDMEIVTVVLEGALAHRDSMGHGSTIHAGDVQVMSAGRGVTHSEFNASDERTSHSLQIWMRPARVGIEPRYAQAHFDDAMLRNRLQPVVSHDARDGSLAVCQDVTLYRCRLEAGAAVTHRAQDERVFWIQVVAGVIEVAGTLLYAGDGARIDDESELRFKGIEAGDFLLFDLRPAA